jgi:hypothetical protein
VNSVCVCVCVCVLNKNLWIPWQEFKEGILKNVSGIEKNIVTKQKAEKENMRKKTEYKQEIDKA